MLHIIGMNCTSGETKEVRRTFLPHRSAAGSGIVWQWSGGSNPTGDEAETLHLWHDYAMPVQCLVEDAWGQVRTGSRLTLCL